MCFGEGEEYPTQTSVCLAMHVCVGACQSDAGKMGVFYLESSTHSGYISQTPGDQKSNFPHLPFQELINKILICSRLILGMEPQPKA